MIAVLLAITFSTMALAASLVTTPPMTGPSLGNTFIVRLETVGTVNTALPTSFFGSTPTLSYQASFRNGGDILTPSTNALTGLFGGNPVVLGPHLPYTTISFLDPSLNGIGTLSSVVFCLNSSVVNGGNPACSSPLAPIGSANGLVFNTIFIAQTTTFTTGQEATCTTTNPSQLFSTTNISTIQTGFTLTNVLNTPAQPYDCATIPVFMRGFAPACTVLVEDVDATTVLGAANEVVHFKANVLSASTTLSQTAFQASPSFAPAFLPRDADYVFDITSTPALVPNGGVDRTVELFFDGTTTPTVSTLTFDSCWVSVLNVAHRETNGVTDNGANFLFQDGSSNVFHYGSIGNNAGPSNFIELPASTAGVSYTFIAFSNNNAATAVGFSGSQFNASALQQFNSQASTTVSCKTNKFSLVTLSTSGGSNDQTQFDVTTFDVTPNPTVVDGFDHQIINLINPGFSTTTAPSINVLQLTTSTVGSTSTTICNTHVTGLAPRSSTFDAFLALSETLSVTTSDVTCACSINAFGSFTPSPPSGCGRHVTIITGRVQTFQQEICTTSPVSPPTCTAGSASFQNHTVSVVQTNLDVLNTNDNSFIGFSSVPVSSGVTIFKLDIPNCNCAAPPPPPTPAALCTSPCEAAILAAVDSIKPPSPTPTSCSSSAQVASLLKEVKAVKKSTDTIRQLRQKIIAVHKSIFRQCRHH